uniref:Prepropeptide n=1 Tax=Tripedalia cystophora TaxID=6141 RepID=A0A482A247_TRICY|nr:prepropeptide [Tripedalia cystophora]
MWTSYYLKLFLGLILMLAIVRAAPREDTEEEEVSDNKRDAFAKGQMGHKANTFRETMIRGNPKGPSILWGRNVGAKDNLKNMEITEELQPGMWGKRSLVQPRLNMLWGRAMKEESPRLGLWGREKEREMLERPKVGLWGRSSKPGKVGLWGRQMQGHEYQLPDRPIEGLWGKEIRARGVEDNKGRSDELERELENKIISLFHQLKSAKQRREATDKGKPGTVGLWGK